MGPGVLEAPAGDVELLEQGGGTGDLEFLHPCVECPEISKYQAVFDKYRLAFFLNSSHNASEGKQEWMLGAVD
eukprot:10798245-Heterocapsa_arctica.AAC.1